MVKVQSKQVKAARARRLQTRDYERLRYGDAAGMMDLPVTVNGQPQVWRIHTREYLLEILRREGYRGAKRGCETGDCGACTVLVDGQAQASCLMLSAQVHGRSLTTIEGLGRPDQPHRLQKAFVETGATQCGYCNPGMVLSARALLDRTPHPTDEEIRTALDGVLCRCTGYVKQIEAVKLAIKLRGDQSPLNAPGGQSRPAPAGHRGCSPLQE